MTQEDKLTRGMESPGQAAREVIQENPYNHILSCEGDRKTSREVAKFTLSRKASIKPKGARTANRHR